MWNAVRRSVVRGYPQGAAAKANVMPLTSLEPVPDFTMIAAASRAHVERCETPADLPAALARAVAVIRSENVIGCQFHPEKSGEAGLKILGGFLLE